jgi:HAD superfamily hydrolase (TIGR01509 family)
MQLYIPPGDFAGYIFDLDGTLIDTMPVHYRAWQATLHAAGLAGPLDEDYFYALGGVPSNQVAALLAQRHGLLLREPAHAIAEAKERRYLEAVRSAGTLAHIEPVVAFARAVARVSPVAIATGGTPDIAWPALMAAGLDDLFKIVITPHDIPPGRGKPHPDIFLEAARRLAVTPTRCLVFEDGVPGMQGARAAGMQVVEVVSRRR